MQGSFLHQRSQSRTGIADIVKRVRVECIEIRFGDGETVVGNCQATFGSFLSGDHAVPRKKDAAFRDSRQDDHGFYSLLNHHAVLDKMLCTPEWDSRSVMKRVHLIRGC